MKYAINNMHEPIPQIHLYDYFAYLDLIIFLFMYLTIMMAYNKETSTANRKKVHLLMQAQVQEEQGI